MVNFFHCGLFLEAKSVVALQIKDVKPGSTTHVNVLAVQCKNYLQYKHEICDVLEL